MGGAATGPLLARTAYTITMQNADPADPSSGMAFSPDLLKVRAGASVTFTVGSGAHNSQSTSGMLPDGAQGWRFGIRKSGTVTLTRPGFYGYHCLPHRRMGMVGLIIVEGEGMTNNLEAAKARDHPGKAAARWADLWQRAERII
ncbi:MAG: plastocyanin/azurin family copper-binding protein [Pseudomonadota bacterium]